MRDFRQRQAAAAGQELRCVFLIGLYAFCSHASLGAAFETPTFNGGNVAPNDLLRSPTASSEQRALKVT
jgi:hypothetical protein